MKNHEISNSQKLLNQKKCNEYIKQLGSTPAGFDSWHYTPQSSNIAGYFYNTSELILQVNFVSGGTYIYLDVDPQIVHLWGVAASKGSFFYYNIRTTYEYIRIN